MLRPHTESNRIDLRLLSTSPFRSFQAESDVHRSGGTAWLGADGNAISFACERYAQSLPDIESYIEQKIPVEPITSDLLTALPRKPREGVEANAEEGESIGEIFKEAREQRAADDARRGQTGRACGRERVCQNV